MKERKKLLFGFGISISVAASAFAAVVVSGGALSTSESSLVTIPASGSSAPTLASTSAANSGIFTLANGSKLLSVDPLALVPRKADYVGGVQTHFAYAQSSYYAPDKVASLMNTTGFKSHRDDIYWNAFAPDWDLMGAHLPTELQDFWGRSSAKPLLIINNGNPYVPGTMPPITEAGRNLFAGFAARAAKATLNKDPIYEIWNEWNMNAVLGRERINGAGEINDPRAALYYAPLAIASSLAIRAEAPKSTILVAASGDDETWEWTREVVELGGLKHGDGLSVHLYNHCQAPQLRNATEFVDRLDRLRSMLSNLPDGNKPIYITEWGWPTGTNVCASDPKDVAKNVAQFMLYAAATPWIGGSWYYELKDSGKNLADIQNNFGLYDYDYREKPAACTAREAMALINASKGMAVERPFKDAFVVKIRTSWGYQVVAWTTSTDNTATVKVGGTMKFAARAMCGNDRAISGNREVVVGPTPVVMTFVTDQPTTLSVKQ